MPKSSSNRLLASLQYRLVTDRRTDTRQQHTALAQRRAVKISCGRYYIRVLRHLLLPTFPCESGSLSRRQDDGESMKV